MSRSADDIEINLLLEGIYQRYGYDFRNYSRESMKRRIRSALVRSDCKSVLEMLEKVLHDATYYRTLIADLCVNVTEMFRDPEVYLMIRKQLIPILRTYPSINIWHAGCSTGEEVYSMAILMEEEGLFDRTTFYATDISQRALDIARQGIYPVEQVPVFTSNYQKAGGIEPFTNYYTANFGSVKMNSALQKNITFSVHNLATDDIFCEAHVIFCRNVLIYFDRELQARALNLFSRSLVRKGYLCLGTKETVEFSGVDRFQTIDKPAKIYRLK